MKNPLCSLISVFCWGPVIYCRISSWRFLCFCTWRDSIKGSLRNQGDVHSTLVAPYVTHVPPVLLAVASICHFCSAVSLLLSSLGGLKRLSLAVVPNIEDSTLQIKNFPSTHFYQGSLLSLSVHAKAFVRFLQSMPKISWMCKKIGKVQWKTTYCQSSRLCWEVSVLHCQLPVLTPGAFLESKPGTELQLTCGRPRNLTTELNQSHIPCSQAWMALPVHAHWGFAVTGDERTAGQQNSRPSSVQRWNCSL